MCLDNREDEKAAQIQIHRRPGSRQMIKAQNSETMLVVKKKTGLSKPRPVSSAHIRNNRGP